jgi:hypothetical protein
MPRRILLITVVVVLALAAGCAKRNTAYQEPKILNLLQQIPVVGDPSGLSFDDDNLYVALDQGGITVVNRNTYAARWWTEILPGGSDSQLVNTRLISAVPSLRMLFIGEFVGADKIRIADISEPDSVRLIDSITGGTDGLADLHFYPIANPTDDNVVYGIFNAGRTVNFCRFNGNLYLGTDWTINTPATASGVDLNATHVFVAAQQRGLVIYNRNDQQLISELAVPGEAQKVKVVGNYAYIAARQGGFHIVDISNPAVPVLRGSYDTTGYATSVDVSGNLAVVSSGGGGVYVFDISNPGQPILKEALTSAGYTNNAKFMNDKVVVASRDNGVLVYSLDLPDK